MRSKDEIEALAAKTLAQHGLDRIPVDPVAVAEKLGIQVFNAKFSDAKLAALLSRRGPAAMVLVNEADAPNRKRFSIGHEIGHFLLHLERDGEMVDQADDMFRTTPGDESVFKEAWRPEVEANQFSAALLMPAEHLRVQWRLRPSVTELARIFNVSEEAMQIRLAQLRLA